MTKNKIIITSLIGILIANFILIGFLFFRKPPHPRMLGPKKIIIESLHFDKNQEAQFEGLIRKHKTQMSDLKSQLNNSKVKLYKTLSTSETDKVKADSIFSSIATLNSQIETMHYNHFLDIKNICKPDQLKDYKVLTSKMAQFFSTEPPKKK